MFKIVFALIAVGGGWALFRTSHHTPAWVWFLGMIFGLVLLILALHSLPETIEAVEKSVDMLKKWIPASASRLVDPAIRVGDRADPPPSLPLPSSPRGSPIVGCAAVVMSRSGAWDASGGRGPCAEHIERALTRCRVFDSLCPAKNAGPGWVVGVRCVMAVGPDFQALAVTAARESVERAFAQAYGVAQGSGFVPPACRRIVAIHADRGDLIRF